MQVLRQDTIGVYLIMHSNPPDYMTSIQYMMAVFLSWFFFTHINPPV